MRKRFGLTERQYELVTTFDRWLNCQVVAFPVHTEKRIRYALEFWYKDKEKVRRQYPNPRTVEALIRRDVLSRILDAENSEIVYRLSPEWDMRKKG